MAETKLFPSKVSFDVTADLSNVEIRVEGSALNAGGFTSWGTTRTNIDGNFTLTARKPNAPRRIRVSARFQDDSLNVTAPRPLSDWSVVYESDGKLPGPQVPLATYTFRRSGNPQDDDHYKRAATWYLCRTVIDTLIAHDPWFAFKDRVNIVYPAKAISGSYANGLTRSVYINFVFSNDKPPDYGDQWDVPTVLHEFMHIWNYDHNSGSSRWLGAILWDLSTHSFQEREAIAFHEGFAEYAKDELLHHIWGLAKEQPRSRDGLISSDRVGGQTVAKMLDSLSMVEHNEHGVLAALHLLTTPNIYKRVFGAKGSSPTNGIYAGMVIRPGSCPEAPTIDFWDVLSIFKPHPEAGWPTAWEAKQTLGIFQFYERASDILPDFDDETRDMYVSLLDRQSTTEPQDRCEYKLKR